MRLDGVRLSVPDPPTALAAYTRLLGCPATRIDDGRWRLQLERGAVEVTAGTDPAPRLAVLFATEAGDDLGAWPTDPGEHGGLEVVIVSDLPTEPAAFAPEGVVAIDHVVVHTADPERAIAHWRGRLGLRLALDRTFPERKLRLLFFRSGGLTLEYAHALDASPGVTTDVVYGVSYRVRDVAAARTRLVAAGLDVSDLRAGMKPGSTVATVRSGTAGVPTLLIQPPAGP